MSAENSGNEIEFEKIEKIILPQLKRNHVTKVTLTGGEPFVYSRLLDVVTLLSQQDVSVCICTNASLITEDFLDKNKYAAISEYTAICNFAKRCGANYVLMNPLSQFGRGEEGVSRAYNEEQMRSLQMETEKYNDSELEIVYIRFPNMEQKPLGECVAGKIMYIFTNGDIAYCPYMVFAAQNAVSKYSGKQFMIGNIFEEGFDWEGCVKNYHFPVSFDETCAGCMNTACKKGCYAARISCGNMLTDADSEICPLYIK